jgi:glycosyltransferase involved in cell wall biosynthesis
MKVVLIHSRLLRRGGLETRLFSYANYLCEHGHEVSVIVHKVGSAEGLHPDVQVIHSSLKHVPKPFRAPFFDRRVGRIVGRLEHDFALSLTKSSHQHAVLAPGNHIGFLKAIDKRTWTPIDRLMIRLEKRAFESTPVILVALEMMKDELIRYYRAPADKITVLWPPIDPGRFTIDLISRREEFRRKYGFAKDKTSFLLVSSSHGRKGLPLLLDVFEALREEPVELVVAGAGEVQTSLPNVRYLGFVEATEELYAAADYTVLPAQYEPFGQVVAESIMCGTPVLVSSRVGARDIIGPGEGIVLRSLKATDWMEAIRNIDQRDFSISPDFAAERKIRLEDHMERILEIASQFSH